MKTVKNLKLKFTVTLTALVFAATANALPTKDGSMVINEQYGHECFDPEAAMPGNEAMSTMTSSMNCNSIPDPIKFCQCVEVIAEPLGITNFEEEFKQAFVRAQILKNKRNKNMAIGIKFRDEFLGSLINTEGLENGFDGESGCGKTFEVGGLDNNPVAQALNSRMSRELVDIMEFKRGGSQKENSEGAQSFDSNPNISRARENYNTLTTEEERQEWQKQKAELGKMIETNAESVKRAEAIEKENNRRAVAKIIRFMATTESHPGSGKSFAKEFLNPTGQDSSHGQNSNMGLLDQRKVQDTEKSKKSHQIFMRVLDQLQEEPLIKNSSLGLTRDRSLMTDINQIFNAMVTESLKDIQLNKVFDINEVIGRDQFKDEEIESIVEQTFETTLNSEISKKCEKLKLDYLLFLGAFKETGHHTEAFSYQDAEQEYNDIFKSNNLNAASKEKAERAYRLFELKLSQGFGQIFSETPHKLMVAIDLNYCNTAPTSPKPEVALQSKMNALAAAGAPVEYEEGVNYTVADGGRTPASVASGRRVINKELLTKNYNKSLALNRKYKDAITVYDTAALKRAKKEIELEREKRALRTLEQDPGSDHSIKNLARNRIAELQGEIEAAKIVEANAIESVEKAHEEFAEHDRYSFLKHGDIYRKQMDANLGHLVDSEDCIQRYIKNEEGRLVPNPNWSDEAAACMTKIQQELFSELDIPLESNKIQMETSSYYSTNAKDNINLSTKRTEMRDTIHTIANNSTVQELAQIGEDLGKSLFSAPSKTDSSDKRPKKRPDNINSQNNALKNSSSKEDSDPFATEKEFNEKEIERLEKLNDSSLAESGLEKGFDEERIQARKSKNTDSTLPDNEVGEKFTQIAETLGQLPGVDGKNTSGQSSDGKVKSTSKIQKEAEAIIEREEELKRAQAKIEAQKQEDAKIAANANTAAISPEYEKLLAEVKALREQNLELQKGVTSMTEQRKAEVVAADNAQRRQATIEQQVANEAEINNPQNFENQGFAASGRSPASDNSAERTQIVNNGVKKANAVVNNGNSAPANVAANQNKVATVTPLPTPTSRGGELQNATVALNSAISLEAKALPILSGVDQSREILTGNEGLNGYLNLVGSKNELTMDSFNEIRLDPAKFAQFEIDSSQPIIIKTPNGHMVMLAVVEGDQVKGFRYVKEIKPEHVERRIASEQEEILEEKRRIIYEANLDALFEETTK